MLASSMTTARNRLACDGPLRIRTVSSSFCFGLRPRREWMVIVKIVQARRHHAGFIDDDSAEPFGLRRSAAYQDRIFFVLLWLETEKRMDGHRQNRTGPTTPCWLHR